MKNTQNSNTVLVQLYMYLYPYDFMKHTQNSNTSTFPRNRNPHRSESEGKMLHQQGETQSFPLRRTRPIAVVVMNAAMKCLPRMGQTFRPFKRLRHLGRSNQFKLVQTIVRKRSFAKSPLGTLVGRSNDVCKRLTQPRRVATKDLFS